jgi:serine phosphatase RsbU (regulator of sigma subunit)/PAS domain-containing protein
MAHSTLPLQDAQRLLMSDYGSFLLIEDWRQELRSKGQLVRFYELLRSESRRKLIDFLSECEDAQDNAEREIILTYNRGFQNQGYFRLTFISHPDFAMRGLILFVRNISDEYNAFVRLEKVESDVRSFFDYSPQGFIFSKEDEIVYMSPKVVDLSGLTTFNKGKSLSEIIPQAAGQSVATLRRKKNHPNNVTIQSRHGMSEVVNAYIQPFQIKGDTFKFISLSEANSSHKVENDLIRYLVGFKQIADSVPGVLFQVCIKEDGTPSFSYFSEASSEILGFSADVLRTNPQLLRSRINENHIEKLKRSFIDAISSNSIWEDEVSFTLEDNTERWIRVRGAIRLNEGTYEVSGIIHNITQEKNEIAKQYQIKQSLLKLHRENAVQKGDINTTYRLVVNAVKDCIGADRISFWYFDEIHSTVTCDYAHAFHGRSIPAGEMHQRVDFPEFFAAIEKDNVLIVNDVHVHKQASALINDYLIPHNVGAFITTTVVHNGQVVGVIQIEHLGGPRSWQAHELQFVRNISELLSYVRSVNEKTVFEDELMYLNTHLSQLVQVRTIELTNQRQEIEAKNQEITSSLRYAKHIQSAILPDDNFFQKLFEDSFVFYLPKDIVAGDFYWCDKSTQRVENSENFKETLLVAACDCTGHGVPGAMMSMLASSALSRAVHQYNLTAPNEILFRVNEILRENMNKGRNQIYDGMDASICSIEYADSTKKKATLRYAGANSPIWIMKRNEWQQHQLQIIKGDKTPIGMETHTTEFKMVDIELNQGDIVFMFSDGMADQFGGLRGKKMKYKKMHELINDVINLPMSMQKRCLESAFYQWKGTNEQVDDVLVIGIRI